MQLHTFMIIIMCDKTRESTLATWSSSVTSLYIIVTIINTIHRIQWDFNLPKEQIHLASNMASSVVCVLVSSTNAHLLADAHPDQASTDQGEMRHADNIDISFSRWLLLLLVLYSGTLFWLEQWPQGEVFSECSVSHPQGGHFYDMCWHVLTFSEKGAFFRVRLRCEQIWDKGIFFGWIEE